MKRKLLFILAMTILAVAGYSKNNTNNMTKKDKWDKVFPLSENVRHKKVEFKNQYGITLSGDLYIPAKIEKGVKYPALAVCGPFGASKEQSSGLYAMKMAERIHNSCL